MPRIFPKTVSVLLASAAFFALLPAQASARDVLERFDFDLTGGSRVDQFDWNIAGNVEGDNPDVLSELAWKDLKSNQVSARAKAIMTNDRVPFGGEFRIGGNYGEIYSGSNQDSDYNGDDRTREYSRSNNHADSGEVWDGSLGGGLVFFNRSHTLSLAPLVGFSLHQQNLTIHKGYQTISDPNNAPNSDSVPPAVGPIAGLNSTYDAKWRTGWLGLDIDFIPMPYFDLHGTVELHSGRYEAEADWNLRGNLAHPRSFNQTSDQARGVVANIGVRAGVRNVLLTVDFNYQKWRAKDGEDNTYINDGSIWVTKLNEVNWEAASVTGGVTVRF
ncbi:MAG: hypothetical protein HGA96_12130 [Desulfobulbaceae bacterium]|nr:hypothetical protein [Desulfobulbaceae bacterium]